MLFKLFIVFFEVGLFSFGGGYGMLPLMLEKATVNGWLTEAEFTNFLAISEATPGPIAVNMATYVGSTQAGFLGSLFATLGAITPSIIIILLIVAVFKNFLQYRGVRWALDGMKPVICGMIIATGATLALANILPNIESFSTDGFSLVAIIITAIIAAAAFFYKRWKKKNLSPIIIIVVSALLGIILF